MNWLVLGSGGREHAIAWKLAQSPLVHRVFVAPGNPGMSSTPGGKTVPLGVTPNFSAVDFCRRNGCDHVVVGPEAPLAQGIVDELECAGIRVLGPSRSAARLEASKSFARRMIDKAGAPGPEYRIVPSVSDLPAFVRAWPWRRGMVIKADGLAAGKGVFVCQTREEALMAVETLKSMDKSSGGTLLSNGLVCEELLPGREVSAFILCDGKDFVWFGSACDHKRLCDGDKGPNTGGMGAYSPAPWLDERARNGICERIFAPVLATMAESGCPFRGFLFAGLMQTATDFNVLEFNVRLGDPETQVLLPLLDEDFAQLLAAAMDGKLGQEFARGLKWRPASAVHVVKAARGYPGIDGAAIESGARIESSNPGGNHIVFYSGVAEDPSGGGGLVSAGGRVLGVTSVARSLADASAGAYEGLAAVNFDGAQWRRDIAR
ncbi:MAG: hypothetical protein RIQ81_235 [Pseudomonadota bacterium]